MPLVATPAIVLHAFRYSETSKIVRLATRELGLQSAIAKGAFRKKSPFGGFLEFLSEGVAQLHYRDRRELQTLAGFEVSRLRTPLAHDLARFAAGSALAEMMLRMAPPAPLPQAYDTLRAYLELLEAAPGGTVESVALRAGWRLVTVLGFGPGLGACVRDGEPVGEGAGVGFSTAEGGVLCPRCAGSAGTSRLKAVDYRDLQALIDDAQDIPDLEPRRAAAHRRLLVRFIQHHVGDTRPFPALEWWEHRPWAAAS